MIRNWTPRRAAEVDYRGANWKNELDPAETIADYGFEPTGVNVDGKAVSGTRTIATLSGGTVGDMAEVVAWVETSAGRRLEVLFKIRIE